MPKTHLDVGLPAKNAKSISLVWQSISVLEYMHVPALVSTVFNVCSHVQVQQREHVVRCCRCTSHIDPADALPVPNQKEVPVKPGEAAPVPAERQAAAEKPTPAATPTAAAAGALPAAAGQPQGSLTNNAAAGTSGLTNDKKRTGDNNV